MIWLILTLGLILRLINLNQSLWLDEAVQAITSQGSFAGIFTELQGDFHPPLYHLLMWIWVHLFGVVEVVLRLPSVLFGLATIYIVFLIAKDFFPKKNLKFYIFNFTFAELSALFLATAPFHIYYSQEARPYALVTFLTICSMYFFLKQKWLGYILSTVLALYSSYFVFFIILAQGLIILINKKYSQYLYILISLFLFIPWLPMLLKQIQVGQETVFLLPEWGKLVNADFVKALPLTFLKFIIGRITIFDKNIYAIVSWTLLIVYGLIVAQGFFKNKKLQITLWLVVPIVSTWFISLFTPNYQPFRLLLVLPAFYLLLAFGISSFSVSMIRIILTTIILGINLMALSIYYFNPYFHREDWRGVVRFIESQSKLGIALLPSSTSDWPWRYYSSGKVTLFGVSPSARRVEEEDFKKISIYNSQFTIYYLPYLQPVFDPQEKISAWLQKAGYVKIREVSFNQIPVWEYAFLK